MSVSTSVTGVTTPEIATAVANTDENDTAGSEIEPQDIPPDAFVVSIASARHPASTVASVTGAFNWRDEFIGQGSPVDLAALRFSDPCVIYGGTWASTYTWEGVATNRAYLRSAGVGTGGPVWNIADWIASFINFTDNGVITQSVDLAECAGTVQAAFDYEGNVGSSILSVSLAWGGLSVTYGSGTSAMQLSSGAVAI